PCPYPRPPAYAITAAFAAPASPRIQNYVGQGLVPCRPAVAAARSFCHPLLPPGHRPAAADCRSPLALAPHVEVYRPCPFLDVTRLTPSAANCHEPRTVETGNSKCPWTQ